MMAQIASNQLLPKPLFVIGDVESGSYTTALSTGKKINGENLLICGTNNGEIVIWSLENFRCLFRHSFPTTILPGDILRINSVNTINNELLIVDFKVSDILLLNLDFKELNLIQRWNSYETTFSKCFLLEAINFVAFLLNPNVIELIDLNFVSSTNCTRKIALKLCHKKDHGIVMTMNLFLLNDEELYILISYEDGFVLLYQTSFGKTLRVLSAEFQLKNSKEESFEARQISEYKSHSDMVTCLDFHQDSMRGVTGSVDNQIKLWQIVKSDTGFKIVENLKNATIEIKNPGLLSCSIRPDGRLFCTGGKDGRIRLFTLKGGKPLAVLDLHSNAIECTKFVKIHLNPEEEEDSKKSTNYYLIASSRDQSISIWSLYNN